MERSEVKMTDIITAYDKFYRSRCDVRNIHGCGVILFDNYMNNMVIVKQVESKKWGFPKGHLVNTCEQHFKCAKREMYDETGINLDCVSYMKYGTIILNQRLFYILSLKKMIKFHLKPIDKGEISESKWIDINSLISSFEDENEMNKTLRDFIKLMRIKLHGFTVS